MEFSIKPGSLAKALRVLARKHPSHAARDPHVQIRASADGIVVDTNGSSAFLPAQVVVAGTCLAPRVLFTRVMGTYPKGQPVTIEAAHGELRVGQFRMPIPKPFRYGGDESIVTT